MQIPSSPGSVSIGLRLVRDVLRTLDDSVRLVVAVRPGTDLGAMRDLLRRWGHPVRRVRWAEAAVPSLFAQDNAVTLIGDRGKRSLLLPRKDNRIGLLPGVRRRDLERAYGLSMRRSRLYWDGGNLCRDGSHCLVGANTLAQNMVENKRSAASVRRGLSQTFGGPVTVLGDVDEALHFERNRSKNLRFALEGGQADFHLDLDISLLGRMRAGEPPVAALASTEIDLDLVDDILERDELFVDHFLPPGEMRRIFLSNLGVGQRRRATYLAHYRDELERLGYRVVEIPDFRLLPDLNYLGRLNFTFNYLNVIAARNASGEAVCYYLSYGLDRIEQRVEEVYAAVGVRAIAVNPESPVTGNDIMLLRGGLHCATSKLR